MMSDKNYELQTMYCPHLPEDNYGLALSHASTEGAIIYLVDTPVQRVELLLCSVCRDVAFGRLVSMVMLKAFYSSGNEHLRKTGASSTMAEHFREYLRQTLNG